jgi:hypothetical protein
MIQSIFNLTYNSAFLGCSCRYILPSTKQQLKMKSSESAFQQAPSNFMDMDSRAIMSNYAGLFSGHKPHNQESIIAKLIYTYVQYQNAFEKSQPTTESPEAKATTPGLIQQSIIPLPQGTHVHHDVT